MPNPEKESEIADALLRGDEEKLNELGVKEKRGLSKKEALHDQEMREEKAAKERVKEARKRWYRQPIGLEEESLMEEQGQTLSDQKKPSYQGMEGLIEPHPVELPEQPSSEEIKTIDYLSDAELDNAAKLFEARLRKELQDNRLKQQKLQYEIDNLGITLPATRKRQEKNKLKQQKNAYKRTEEWIEGLLDMIRELPTVQDTAGWVSLANEINRLTNKVTALIYRLYEAETDGRKADAKRLRYEIGNLRKKVYRLHNEWFQEKQKRQRKNP